MRNYIYKVVLKNRVDLLDDKVLSYLYQPIIGLKSIALYKMLIFEAEIIKDYKKNFVFDENRLISMSFTKSDNLTRQIKRLEAMGLVETLENKSKNSVIFNIYAPLEPIDYFNNKLFNSALIDKIGDTNYELARNIFKDETDLPSDSGYQNTSSKFLEVFEEFNHKLNSEICSNIKPKPKKSNPLLKGLNFNEIVKKLAEKSVFIPKDNKRLKQIIEEVYISYKISIETIIENLVKAYDFEEVDLDINKFYVSISSKYFSRDEDQKQHELFDPELNKQNKTNAKIEEMETIDPVQFLELLMNVQRLDLKELEVIRTLGREYKLRDGVINCLLEFSYLKNEGTIVANYLFKIAKTLNERNISNAKEAMEYLKLAHKKAVKPKNITNFIQQIPASTVVENEESSKSYIIEVDDNAKFDPKLWGDMNG
ncbi:chromosome replication initiation and membrane attachment protein [Spiroplasma helicoides]|uniref:Chromosome replication initiation and membrane attachment protein n=1 Tax=Spiroplasma helicoides TaxID=216938 RepID=A0A1B3SLE5_9MOLU|nr:DnaD domain protein [Spiroplasma helicoides]AOG60742.1 chromosome replication initiation and membrane attachment protein [Spiroplasma helicoides]